MIEIRKLQPDEYHQCVYIWDMQKQSDLANTFYEEMLSGNRWIYICLKEGKVVGEGALVFEKKDPDYTVKNKRIYLSRIVVKKENRREGLGSLIVDYLINVAQELGYREISIGVDVDNIAALQLYKGKGFLEVLYHGTDDQGEFFKLLRRTNSGAQGESGDGFLSAPSKGRDVKREGIPLRKD